MVHAAAVVEIHVVEDPEKQARLPCDACVVSICRPSGFLALPSTKIMQHCWNSRLHVLSDRRPVHRGDTECAQFTGQVLHREADDPDQVLTGGGPWGLHNTPLTSTGQAEVFLICPLNFNSRQLVIWTGAKIQSGRGRYFGAIFREDRTLSQQGCYGQATGRGDHLGPRLSINTHRQIYFSAE